jgi:hypothetical protein
MTEPQKWKPNKSEELNSELSENISYPKNSKRVLKENNAYDSSEDVFGKNQMGDFGTDSLDFEEDISIKNIDLRKTAERVLNKSMSSSEAIEILKSDADRNLEYEKFTFEKDRYERESDNLEKLLKFAKWAVFGVFLTLILLVLAESYLEYEKIEIPKAYDKLFSLIQTMLPLLVGWIFGNRFSK